MNKGIFIVIEGGDGSGKTTHLNLLKEHLEAAGKEVALYKFPQYEKPSSYFSVQYLNGKYGDANKLGAYKPSLFYALDRFDASFAIQSDIEAGKVVLCDRFVGSNMAHQGQKIANDAERVNYFDWIYNLEFKTLGIPEPDLNLVLLMPVHHAYGLMEKRVKRSYTDKQHDIHEADKNHLERAVATYRELTNRYNQTFTAVECAHDDALRSIDEIQTEIRSIVDNLI
jgi:dTMP kinase